MKNIFYKQREDFLKTLPERDKKFTFPDDVEEIKNVPYASDGLPVFDQCRDVFAAMDLSVSILRNTAVCRIGFLR